MSGGLSIASSAVSWSLTLWGVNWPTGAVESALPRRGVAARLERLITPTTARIDAALAEQGEGLAPASVVTVQRRFQDLLDRSETGAMLDAALEGRAAFVATLVGPAAKVGLSEDERGYLHALASVAHRLVIRWAQTRVVLRAASAEALRLARDRLNDESRPVRVPARLRLELATELRARQVVAAGRPLLDDGYVPREEGRRLAEALAGGGIATLAAADDRLGVGTSTLAAAFAAECERAGWDFVGWVAAASRDQAIIELARLARSAGLTAEADAERAAAALVSRLSAGRGDRLLVFDDVRDAGELDDLIPVGPASGWCSPPPPAQPGWSGPGSRWAGSLRRRPSTSW